MTSNEPCGGWTKGPTHLRGLRPFDRRRTAGSSTGDPAMRGPRPRAPRRRRRPGPELGATEAVRPGPRMRRHRRGEAIDGDTVGQVLDGAVERYGPRLAAVIGTSAIWLNGEAASRDLPVGDDDEVAVLPPVSGG